MLPDLTAAPATSPLSLYRYRDGLYAVDLLTAAIVELDLFTWLADHPSSAEDVCAHFGLQTRPADVLLTLCVARGYLARRQTAEGDVYVVTEVGREHLTASSPWNLAPYFASLRERPLVHDFVQVLRTGRPAGWAGANGARDWHAAMADEAFARRFIAAMDCRGLYLGEALTRAVDLGASRRLLDVGGGSGIYACAFAARHPSLHATVLDQSPVDAVAARLIAARGFAARVDVTAADFLADPWPTGYDVHLLSNVLHDWDLPVVRQLLAASAHSLTAGGLLVIHDAFLDGDKAGPVAVAEYSCLLMHSTQGRCYGTAELEALLDAEGFGACTFAATVADRGVMTARRRSA